MKPSRAIEGYRNAIRSIVENHHASNARIFGSVAHGEDVEDSDLDLLVDPTQETTLFDIAAIRLELRKMLGISVDVFTPAALPKNFRDQVVAEAVSV